MKKLRVVVVGAGNMAHIRTTALLKLEQVEICGVAAKHKESAVKFARNFNINYATADYRTLASVRPDAILIELPHKVQDEVVCWALDNQLHILIGGCLATNSELGMEIATLAEKHKLIVECGYEARYKPCWHYVKNLLKNKVIGSPCFVKAIALWQAPKNSWYTQQQVSGGMPVTHMTYAFLNPLRWLFGDPLELSAMANRISPIGVDYVNEQSCIVSIRFPEELLVSLTAGYVSVPTAEHWQLEIIGTNGMIQIHPGDIDTGEVVIHSEGGIHHETFSESGNAYETQAEVYVNSITSYRSNLKKYSIKCANPPLDSLKDIQLAEAIVRSAATHQTISL